MSFLDKLPSATREFIESRPSQCKFVQTAIDRFLAQLKDPRFFFDSSAVQRAHEIFLKFRHFQGRQFKGHPFILLPWQSFVVSNLWGLKWADTGRKVYRVGYIEIGRKNGKTEFAGGLSALQLLDGDDAPEIYTVATSEYQAKKTWTVSSKFLRNSPFRKFVQLRSEDILFSHKNGVFKYLASDSKRLDGLNISFAIADELHAWPDRALWDVLDGSTGARQNPQLIAITTAGEGSQATSSFCYSMRADALDAMEGTRPNESIFTLVFTLDEEDDPFNESVWISPLFHLF